MESRAQEKFNGNFKLVSISSDTFLLNGNFQKNNEKLLKDDSTIIWKFTIDDSLFIQKTLTKIEKDSRTKKDTVVFSSSDFKNHKSSKKPSGASTPEMRFASQSMILRESHLNEKYKFEIKDNLLELSKSGQLLRRFQIISADKSTIRLVELNKSVK